MEDLISRQAVLKLPRKTMHNYFGEVVGDVVWIDDIESLPPAQPIRPKGEWIPVSERLPESSGVYIVTREFNDGFECADLTDACYFDGTGTWHNDNRINHDRAYVDKKIKAWMPLPEPFKGGE